MKGKMFNETEVNLSGLGADEQMIIAKYNLDMSKPRNSRQRSSFARKIRYFMGRERIYSQIQQARSHFMQRYWEGYGERHRN